MTGTNVIEKEAHTEWSLDHPRVRELWRTTNEAHVTIADAIEEAAHAGVPVEIIATTTGVPVREVRLILKDAEADEEVMWA
jgi:ribosomal protein S12 methylthiotransferase accessory factor YcaO